MAAAGPSSSAHLAPARAWRRWRRDDDVTATGTARRWGSPRRRQWGSPRRRMAGDGLLRRGLVGDNGIGSAAAPVRLSVERAPALAADDLAEGSRPTAILPATGTAPPSPSLLFLQIRFSSS
uniref:Uncharacterized protein n=1 Tax=Oryza meridionalis TaxID=40149 RepID=A0A0E0C2V9_9ORYZ